MKPRIISILTVLLLIATMVQTAQAEQTPIKINNTAELIRNPVQWFNDQSYSTQMAVFGLIGIITTVMLILVLGAFGKSLLQIVSAKKTQNAEMNSEGVSTQVQLIVVIILMSIALAMYLSW